jgi:hypothetical protein
MRAIAEAISSQAVECFVILISQSARKEAAN